MGSLEHGTFDTKLHEAVRYSDLDAVRVALQQGYDPNLIGLYQWSALHEASHNGEEDIIKLLLKHKGNPDKPDSLDGFTACHYAAQAGHVDCLSLLLAAGGHWDITNKQGQTTLDVAVEDCRNILNLAKCETEQKLEKETKKTPSQVETKTNPPLIQVDPVKDDASISGESTAESINQDHKTIKDRKNKDPVLGYLHLTFEYHAKKTTLKIRVWQVTDLLLPPPTTSMIHSIYVKTYLMPDKKKNSKRKTEEVRVESTEAHLQVKKGSQGFQHVYSPSTFKFTKPLEYTDVTSDMVKEQSVQLEVCITQKYSKRSFLIGQYHLPLKSAVRKLVRTSYPLIPCMNHTIPNNMKVYYASELQITNSAQVFYSNPNIRNLSLSDFSEGSERALSELELTGVTIGEDPSSTSDHSVVKVKDFDEDVELKTSLKRVTILDDEEFNPEMVKVNMNKVSGSSVQGSEVKDKGSASSVTDLSHHSLDSQETNPSMLVHIPEKSNLSQDQKHRKKRYKADQGKHTDSQVSSARPETPTWDYYDFDTGTSVIEIPFEDPQPVANRPNIERPTVHRPTVQHHASAPICLPMDTTMGLQAERRSQRQKGHRRTDKNLDTIPVIVVTQDDVPKSTVVDTSKIKKLSTPKKFIANVTPRDVEIKMDNLGVKPKTKGQSSYKSSKSRSKGATVEIAADVHVDGHRRMNSDTSIEIEPEDSYVIDFEEIGEDNSIMQSDLLKQHKVPMQVFIDETYDSMDEFSVSSSGGTIPSLSLGRRQPQSTKILSGDEDLEVIEV
ncbi:uncharacterized protein LOC110464575 [Mizuhopecten yessoensis]|uniref:Ankyrin-2 n=1 Tax=Mizuhopecten yessoensis TaxID=6573 RepID=A0A210PTM2_MIZYE|nr:uncharacterized protein LOC110464575 [Mizuhopecten yessoensis]OWF39833.1 Ankyrin-2 [Mizuhopecten yessoensis]